jgi:hypothetical protein
MPKLQLKRQERTVYCANAKKYLKAQHPAPLLCRNTPADALLPENLQAQSPPEDR